MSSVVKGVGDAITGVVKGAVNLVKDVAKGVGNVVKSIASTPVGKALLIAATVYFGGAAIAGGYGGFATGGVGGILEGAGAGVSSAASSLSSAWGSLLQGNFSEAGSTLGRSWTAAAEQGAVSNPTGMELMQRPGVSLTEPAPPSPDQQVKMLDSIGAEPGQVGDQVSRMKINQLSNMEPETVANLKANASQLSDVGSSVPANPAGLPPAAPPPGATPTPTMWDKVWSSPYTAPALISGGMQVGGALIQGAAQEKQLQEQRDYEQRMAAEARARYNANVGAPLWNSQQAPIFQANGPAWDPYAEARARAAQMYAPQPTGLAARYMTPTPA